MVMLGKCLPDHGGRQARLAVAALRTLEAIARTPLLGAQRGRDTRLLPAL